MAARIGIAVVAGLLGAGCAPILIEVQNPFPIPAAWSERDDQHRRIAAQIDAWLSQARPLRTVQEAVAELDLGPGSAVFIGEVHDRARWSHVLAHDLLGRGPAALWEEGQLRKDSFPQYLLGLYSGRRHDSFPPGSPHAVLADGSRFNKVFAERAAAGLPERLVVYAGNGHVLHCPEIDGPEAPTGGILPSDAAASAGARVSAIAVYMRVDWLDDIEWNMSQALMATIGSGRRSVADSLAETEWCRQFLTQARDRARGLGTFVVNAGAADAAGKRLLLVVDDETPNWTIGPVEALRRVLDHPSANEERGGEIRLRWSHRTRKMGPGGGMGEEYIFLLRVPASGRTTRFLVKPHKTEVITSTRAP